MSALPHPQHRSLLLFSHRFTCAYCQRRGSLTWGPDGERWHIDHVVPRTLGGSNSLDNKVLACAACNLWKGARLVEDLGFVWLPTERRFAPLDSPMSADAAHAAWRVVDRAARRLERRARWVRAIADIHKGEYGRIVADAEWAELVASARDAGETWPDLVTPQSEIPATREGDRDSVASKKGSR